MQVTFCCQPLGFRVRPVIVNRPKDVPQIYLRFLWEALARTVPLFSLTRTPIIGHKCTFNITAELFEHGLAGLLGEAGALGLGIFLLGVPSAFGVPILAWYNAVAYNLLLPLSVLALLLFVGWVDAGDAVAELRRGTGLSEGGAVAWLWFVRTVVPLGVLVTLLLGLQSLAVRAGLLADAIV